MTFRLTSYKGETQNGIPHGKGKCEYTDSGFFYEGDFVDGKAQGQGKITFLNGDKYEGEFYNDKLHGRGKMIYADGTIEEQIWHEGCKHEGVKLWQKYST